MEPSVGTIINVTNWWLMDQIWLHIWFGSWQFKILELACKHWITRHKKPDVCPTELGGLSQWLHGHPATGKAVLSPDPACPCVSPSRSVSLCAFI